MKTVIRNGRIVTAVDDYHADILVDGEQIVMIARSIDVQADRIIDAKGRLYVTDSDGGAVYRIDAPGKVARILARLDIERPNGIQISPDDRTLYIGTFSKGLFPALRMG